MRKLTIIEHMSLDGVVQNTDEDGFPYHDWTAPYRTPAGFELILAAYGERVDLLLGRRTYDLWSGFWAAAAGNPMADRLNAATKYVVTHRPESLAWGPFEAVGTDVVDGVGRIKAQAGPDLVVAGSSTVTSTLLGHGVADELLAVVYPVLVGTGKRLYDAGTPGRTFELIGTDTTPTGLILARYRVGAPLVPAAATTP